MLFVTGNRSCKVFGMKGTVTLFRRDKRKAFILATIAFGLILGVAALYQKMSIPRPESVTNADELQERIKELVWDLEYPNEVAENFNRIVMDWKDEQWHPILVHWNEKLANAHQDYQEGNISRRKVAKIEESVLDELCKKIKKMFSPEKFFELSDVIQNQQSSCLGYTQLTYITEMRLDFRSDP